jgi:predicted RNA binding protein with dsRBD fold (UPF0201 family)
MKSIITNLTKKCKISQLIRKGKINQTTRKSRIRQPTKKGQIEKNLTKQIAFITNVHMASSNDINIGPIQ